MKYALNTLLLFIMVLGLWSCQEDKNRLTIEVSNPLNREREEIVSLEYDALSAYLADRDKSGVLLKEKGGEGNKIIQWVDYDADGLSDEMLFQVSLAPNETKTYEVVWQENAMQPEPELTTYSRFVPERTDDYTWENDKVAFRTYGPEAQRLIEDGEPGGTLSSGIDLWLKKVNYSIIDKWYAENVKDPGYYHINHGEGYDPYHVGKSRGTGGLGVWQGDTLLTSKNFTAYRTITTGPLRTIFELDYAPWSEYGVKETKRVSLDLGSNFSKFEISVSSDRPVPNYTVGITLHDGKGEPKIDMEHGIFSHWEPIHDAFVGEGIVIGPEVVKDAFAHQSETPDQSQLLVVTDSSQQKLTYYAGFAWTESGQVVNQGEWLKMLENQAEIVANPIEVSVK